MGLDSHLLIVHVDGSFDLFYETVAAGANECSSSRLYLGCSVRFHQAKCSPLEPVLCTDYVYYDPVDISVVYGYKLRPLHPKWFRKETMQMRLRRTVRSPELGVDELSLVCMQLSCKIRSNPTLDIVDMSRDMDLVANHSPDVEGSIDDLFHNQILAERFIGMRCPIPLWSFPCDLVNRMRAFTLLDLECGVVPELVAEIESSCTWVSYEFDYAGQHISMAAKAPDLVALPLDEDEVRRRISHLHPTGYFYVTDVVASGFTIVTYEYSYGGGGAEERQFVPVQTVGCFPKGTDVPDDKYPMIDSSIVRYAKWREWYHPDNLGKIERVSRTETLLGPGFASVIRHGMRYRHLDSNDPHRDKLTEESIYWTTTQGTRSLGMLIDDYWLDYDEEPRTGVKSNFRWPLTIDQYIEFTSSNGSVTTLGKGGPSAPPPPDKPPPPPPDPEYDGCKYTMTVSADILKTNYGKVNLEISDEICVDCPSNILESIMTTLIVKYGLRVLGAEISYEYLGPCMKQPLGGGT